MHSNFNNKLWTKVWYIDHCYKAFYSVGKHSIQISIINCEQNYDLETIKFDLYKWLF